MFRKIVIVLLSIVIGLFAALSTGAALLLQGDVHPVLRLALIVNGVVLFVGAWLLFKRRMAAAAWLLLSAILYFMIAFYDGFLAYGMSAITRPFIAEFYWSLGIRILLPVAAYILLRGASREAV